MAAIAILAMTDCWRFFDPAYDMREGWPANGSSFKAGEVHLRSREFRRATVDNLRLAHERRLVALTGGSWNQVSLWLRQ